MGEGALFLTTSKNLNQTRCSPTGESENTQNKYKMKTSVGQYWRERGQREREREEGSHILPSLVHASSILDSISSPLCHGFNLLTSLQHACRRIPYVNTNNLTKKEKWKSAPERYGYNLAGSIRPNRNWVWYLYEFG